MFNHSMSISVIFLKIKQYVNDYNTLGITNKKIKLCTVI